MIRAGCRYVNNARGRGEWRRSYQHSRWFWPSGCLGHMADPGFCKGGGGKAGARERFFSWGGGGGKSVDMPIMIAKF